MAVDPFKVLLEINVRDRAQGAVTAASRIRGAAGAVQQLDRSISLWTQKRFGEGIARFGAQVSDGLVDAIKKAGDFDQRLTRLSFFVGEDKNTANFRKFSDHIIDLGTRMEQSNEEMVDFSIEAAQAGLRIGQGLEEMVEAAARFQTATGQSSNGLVASISKISDQFKLGGDQVNRLTNALIGVAGQFPVTADFLQGASEQMGTFAEMAGFSIERALTWTAVLAKAIPTERRAGTTFARIIGALTNSKNFKGLSDILDMTQGKIQQLLASEQGVVNLTTLLFKKLAEPPPGKSALVHATELLRKVGITASFDMTPALLIAQSIDMINASAEEMTKRIQESNISAKLQNDILSTLPSAIKRVQDTYTALQIEVGNKFLPVAMVLTETLQGLVQGLRDTNDITKIFVGTLLASSGVLIQAAGGVVAFIAALGLARSSAAETILAMRGSSVSVDRFLTRLRVSGRSVFPLFAKMMISQVVSPIIRVKDSLLALGPKLISFTGFLISGANRFAFLSASMRPFIMGLGSALKFTTLFLAKWALLGIAFGAVDATLKALGFSFGDIFKAIFSLVEKLVDFIAASIGTIINTVIEGINLIISKGINNVPFLDKVKEIEFRSTSGLFSDNTDSILNNIRNGFVSDEQLTKLDNIIGDSTTEDEIRNKLNDFIEKSTQAEAEAEKTKQLNADKAAEALGKKKKTKELVQNIILTIGDEELKRILLKQEIPKEEDEPAGNDPNGSGVPK